MSQTKQLPAAQKALKVRGLGDVRLEYDAPLPVLADDQVLVRVRCVAINPVDAKVLDMGPINGATLGCEFAGDIKQIGASVSNQHLSLGLPVFGCVYGNHPGQIDNGAFAEFVAVTGDLVYALPPHMSYQEGATLGVALPTVAMSTYYPWKFALPTADTTVRPSQGEFAVDHDISRQPTAKSPLPTESAAIYVLIYGGSTTMGATAIQLLRLSGMVPVCTCSPKNFAMVKALGAAAAFDYHDQRCGEAIRRFTGDALGYALDCITNVNSMRICYAAIGRRGGRYMGLDPLPLRAHTRRDVRPDWTLTFTMFNKPLDLGRPFTRPARPKDRDFAMKWYRSTQELVNVPGRIKPHPLILGSDGLEGVVCGLDRMRRGDVSGVKLVYDIT